LSCLTDFCVLGGRVRRSFLWGGVGRERGTRRRVVGQRKMRSSKNRGKSVPRSSRGNDWDRIWRRASRKFRVTWQTKETARGRMGVRAAIVGVNMKRRGVQTPEQTAQSPEG